MTPWKWIQRRSTTIFHPSIRCEGEMVHCRTTKEYLPQQVKKTIHWITLEHTRRVYFAPLFFLLRLRLSSVVRCREGESKCSWTLQSSHTHFHSSIHQLALFSALCTPSFHFHDTSSVTTRFYLFDAMDCCWSHKNNGGKAQILFDHR